MENENKVTLFIKKSRNNKGNLQITLKGTETSVSLRKTNDENGTKDICLGELAVNKSNNQYQQEDRKFYLSIRKNLKGYSNKYYKGYPVKKCRIESYYLNYNELLELRQCIDDLIDAE